jgi:hypothetical protein
MKRLLLFLILIMAIPAILLAQDVPVPPTGWGDIIMNPQKWFIDFGAVAVLTAFLAATATGFFKITKGLYKQLVAWLIAIILLVGSDLINFGYAKDFPILLAVLHGFGAGLAANGVFDIPIIKGILDAVHGWFAPKEPVVPNE